MATAQERAANLKAAFAENDIPWPKARTLYWDQTGPMIEFISGVLIIRDLNPELQTQWRMSRVEMFRLGWNCIKVAIVSQNVRGQR